MQQSDLSRSLPPLAAHLLAAGTPRSLMCMRFDATGRSFSEYAVNPAKNHPNCYSGEKRNYHRESPVNRVICTGKKTQPINQTFAPNGKRTLLAADNFTAFTASTVT